VRWEAVRRITPGILQGTLAGGIAAAWLPDFGLRLFFNLLRAGRTLGRATDDRLPVARLKRIFAGLLYLLSLRML